MHVAWRCLLCCGRCLPMSDSRIAILLGSAFSSSNASANGFPTCLSADAPDGTDGDTDEDAGVDEADAAAAADDELEAATDAGVRLLERRGGYALDDGFCWPRGEEAGSMEAS